MKSKLLIVLTLLLSMSVSAVRADTGDVTPSAEITVIKSVSADGGATWDDAQLAPGLAVDEGASVQYLIQVVNIGDFTLTGVTLTDNMFDTNACNIPATFEPGDLAECIVGPLVAPAGETVNTVLVTAQYDGETLTATDSAYVFGGDVAVLSIEKMVGLGGVWYSADRAPGLVVPLSGKLRFRITVTNQGTETFTNIVLTDSMLMLDACEIPVELPPGLSFECDTRRVEIPADVLVNTATVTATANGETFTASDEAHFAAGPDDGGEIIIIEGPIVAIDGNVIIVLDRRIRIDPNDPLLLVIRVGDLIRVEGVTGDADIIIAIIVIVVDVDIFVGDEPDEIFRDDRNCGNPPPPWAPAHGWRRKCQGTLVTLGALPPGLRDKDKDKKDKKDKKND